MCQLILFQPICRNWEKSYASMKAHIKMHNWYPENIHHVSLHTLPYYLRIPVSAITHSASSVTDHLLTHYTGNKWEWFVLASITHAQTLCKLIILVYSNIYQHTVFQAAPSSWVLLFPRPSNPLFFFFFFFLLFFFLLFFGFGFWSVTSIVSK